MMMEVDVEATESSATTEIADVSDDMRDVPVGRGNQFGNEVMMNDLILDEILNCFQSKKNGTNCIKKFRLINHKCYEMGSAVLYGEKGAGSYLWGQLQMDVPLTKTQEAHLLEHGCNAKIVRLNPAYLAGRDVEQKEFVRQVFLKHLPEMEHLIVSCDRKHSVGAAKGFWDSTFLKPDDVLAKLKLVTFAGDKREEMQQYLSFCCQSPSQMQRRLGFLKEILTSAPNLGGIFNVDSEFLNAISTCGKSSKIKTMHFGCVRSSVFTPNSWFADGQPKLSKVTLDDAELNEVGVALLISSSLATLRRFDLQFRPKERNRFVWAQWLEIEQLPRFENVQTANFGTIVQLTDYLTVEKLQYVLPNLRKVVVESRLEDFIPEVQSVPLPGVTVLEIRARIKEEGFGWIEGWFPCLRKVTVDWKIFKSSYDLTEDRLWLLPNTVEYLELENFDLKYYENYGLDAFLTGLPKEVCKDLQKLKHAVDCDQFREHGRIAALTNLKILKLNIKEFRWKQLKNLKAISYLSRKYALDLLDVKIKLVFPESSYLSNGLHEVMHLIRPIADITTVSFK